MNLDDSDTSVERQRNRSYSVERNSPRNSPSSGSTYAEVASSRSVRTQRTRKRRCINAFRRQNPDRARRCFEDAPVHHSPISLTRNHNHNRRPLRELNHETETTMLMRMDVDTQQNQPNQSNQSNPNQQIGVDVMATNTNIAIRTEEQLELEEMRDFHFNIENDANLQDAMEDEFGDHSSSASASRSPVRAHSDAVDDVSASELTAEYILSKLYNYMKISEMSKYGIRVFEMTFSSYLPYLSEADLTRLATSYWCNGQHFNCMAAHRGDRIKSTIGIGHSVTATSISMAQSQFNSLFRQQMRGLRGQEMGDGPVLTLRITSELLDAAMQSGASVDKIEAMLLQKRRDEGVPLVTQRPFKGSHSPSLMWGSSAKAHNRGRQRFYQTKYEKDFYLRNLKHRFWNHEVLVRVFIQNGWLTPNLADYAVKTFVKSIYRRVLQSQAATSPSGTTCTRFSENFLHSFFVSYFCLDDIPKMYRAQIAAMNAKIAKGGDEAASTRHGKISEETLRRWCELVELLASRGAADARSYRTEFAQMIPLQYALKIGQNTFKIISSSHRDKNRMLIPEHFLREHNICVPDDIWDVLVGYL